MTGRDADPPAGALTAACRGWFVFPTRPGGKEPRAGLSWPRAACNDPARLKRANWQRGENYGVAAKPSGLVVVDLDRPKPGYELPPAWRNEPGVNEGADVLAVLAERAGVSAWPLTFTVATPSGGRHLYFTAPAGRPIGNKPLGPLIDVRGGGNGDGGYVLGPGSVLGGRAYDVLDGQDPAPLPAWVADLLDPPAPPDVPRPVVSLSDARGSTRGRLVGLVSAVLDAKPGERNNVLHWAACRAAEMVATGRLDEQQVFDSLGVAAARTGLDDGEAGRTIASALRHALRSSA